MYPSQGRISGVVFGDLMDQAVSSAGKWSDSFDDANTLNDWVTYICTYATDAARMGTTAAHRMRAYDKLIKAANLALLAATRVRGDTEFGKLAPRHYDV